MSAPTKKDTTQYPVLQIAGYLQSLSGKIVLQKRGQSITRFGPEISEDWKATSEADARSAVAAFLSDPGGMTIDASYDQTGNESEYLIKVRRAGNIGQNANVIIGMDGQSFVQQGSWPTNGGTDFPVQSWDIDLLETSQILAQHPYFARRYIPESGSEIINEIAKADHALETGKPYIPQGSYTKIMMARYYALRCAGVDEYTPFAVELKRNYRMASYDPSTSQSAGPFSTLYANIHWTFDLTADIKPPAWILDALSALKPWVYPSDQDNLIPAIGATDGSPDASFGGNMIWIKKQPRCVPSGPNPMGPYDITEVWWGVQGAAAVLYPGAKWDPKGQTSA
jgi:hypothetical protein